jgi:hypothetical protein
MEIVKHIYYVFMLDVSVKVNRRQHLPFLSCNTNTQVIGYLIGQTTKTDR